MDQNPPSLLFSVIDRAQSMNGKALLAALLAPLMYWWLVGVILTPVDGVDFVLHIAEEGGEHACLVVCQHPISLEVPQAADSMDIPSDELPPPQRLIALLPHPHTARDRPPPLFYSTSHSLRAPPTLMLA